MAQAKHELAGINYEELQPLLWGALSNMKLKGAETKEQGINPKAKILSQNNAVENTIVCKCVTYARNRENGKVRSTELPLMNFDLSDSVNAVLRQICDSESKVSRGLNQLKNKLVIAGNVPEYLLKAYICDAVIASLSDQIIHEFNINFKTYHANTTTDGTLDLEKLKQNPTREEPFINIFGLNWLTHEVVDPAIVAQNKLLDAYRDSGLRPMPSVVAAAEAKEKKQSTKSVSSHVIKSTSRPSLATTRDVSESDSSASLLSKNQRQQRSSGDSDNSPRGSNYSPRTHKEIANRIPPNKSDSGRRVCGIF